jgi:predicted negative regulator of RcsB-dependent stress response
MRGKPTLKITPFSKQHKEVAMAKDDLEYDNLEQSERARAWFERNGSAIVIGILSAVAIIWGYQGWQGGKKRELDRASVAFEAVNAAITEKNEAKISETSLAIRRDFPSTTFAAAASLAEARYWVDQNKLDQAMQALRSATSTGASEEVKAIANLRIAQLQLAKNELDAALKTLNQVKGFQAPVDELKGDILLAQGKRKEALAAYEAALTATDLASPGRSTLELKRDNLSGS